MSPAATYTLRPLERNPPSIPTNALEGGAFRVHLSAKELKALGLSNGDCVRLSTAAGFRGYAVAWLASQTNAGNKPIAKVTDLLREHYDLALNDPVFIEKADSWKPLKSIEISISDSPTQTAKFASGEQLLYWLRHALGKYANVRLASTSLSLVQQQTQTFSCRDAVFQSSKRALGKKAKNSGSQCKVLTHFRPRNTPYILMKLLLTLPLWAISRPDSHPRSRQVYFN